MFLLGYYEDGTPVMGLPGCVMYAGATIFDLVLPWVAADVPRHQGLDRLPGGGRTVPGLQALPLARLPLWKVKIGPRRSDRRSAFSIRYPHLNITSV